MGYGGQSQISSDPANYIIDIDNICIVDILELYSGSGGIVIILVRTLFTGSR